jgi:hypothetical protein
MTLRRDVLEAALAYAARGVPVFPVGLDKVPLTRHGFLDASTDAAAVARAFDRPDVAIGARTGQASRLAVLDLDKKHGDPEHLLDELAQRVGFDPPPTATSRTGGGGLHLFFRLERGQIVKSANGRLRPGADVKGEGGYIILPPSPHASGNCYQWRDEAPDGFLPAIPTAPATWLLALLETIPQRTFAEAQLAAPRTLDNGSTWAASALRHLSADCDYDTWLRIGAALTLHPDGFALFDDWSASAPARYIAADVRRKWDNLVASPMTGISLGTLWHLAKSNGWRPPSAPSADGFTPPTPGDLVTCYTAAPALDTAAARAVADALGALVPNVRPATWATADLARALPATPPPYLEKWRHLPERIGALVPTFNLRGERVGFVGCSTLSADDLASLDVARPERAPVGSRLRGRIFADPEALALFTSPALATPRLLLAHGAARYLARAGRRAEARADGGELRPLAVVGVPLGAALHAETLGALLDKLAPGGTLYLDTEEPNFARVTSALAYRIARAARRPLSVSLLSSDKVTR